MRGDEVPHAPHLAVLADPWPGTVAVYEADADEDYVLNSFVTTGSVIGVTESALGMVPSGRMDRGLPLLVRMLVGDLESVGRAKFLNGGNFFAIGDGVPDNWELFQARTAELVGEQTYQLSNRLRGQLGTERSAGSVWPQGSWVVAVNEGISQLELAARLRNVARHYRIGPATQTYSHETYGHSVHAFKGIGLRPYAPVHLRIERGNAAGSSLSWIRRTRIDGDTWETPEVPVGEDYEKYLVRVRRGAQVLRSQEVGQPFWTYSAGAMSTDGAAVGDIIEVAQISARYGVGKFASTIL
ncbi:phage tail baseplate protein [Shimia isoporae]